MTAALDLWGMVDAQVERETKDYPNNPRAWVHDRLEEESWSKQDEILDSVRVHKRTAVHSCHGIGKSHTASRLAAWWIDSHPPGEAFVVSTAPTHAQVRGILWRYIRQVWKKKRLVGKVTEACEWKIDGDLVGWGRKPADHDADGFQGIHAPKVLVIIDEACGVPEQLWIAAEAITTGDDCRIVAIGNPDDPASHFAKVCRSLLWHVIGISAFDSPNFTDEPLSQSIKSQLVTRQWVQDLADALGVDNPIYISKALGLFPPDDPHTLVRFSDVQRCREQTQPRTEDELLPVVLGVDVGGGGDQTVIRERRGIVAGREWSNYFDKPEQVAESILTAIIESGATRVIVDADGIGWGVVGELRTRAQFGQHTATIVPVKSGSSASDPGRFENLKAELWWEIGRVMSEKHLWDLGTMANADVTIGQLCMPRWDVSPTGKIRVEKKDDLRKRLGRSPDNADALLLAFYAGGPADAGSFLEQLVKQQSPTP